jgi:hypothetical protein
MLRSAASKVMWVGRATVFLVGLAVILALLVGVASMAFARDGQSFILGERNVAQSLSTLVRQEAGPALSLQVDRGAPPLAVNSESRVDNLNADELDGRDASEIGINGYELVSVQSAFDSTAHKVAKASCPEGKQAIGGGARVFPSTADSRRNTAPIVIRYNTPDTFNDRSWTVIADEFQDYGFSWWVSATAICASEAP